MPSKKYWEKFISLQTPATYRIRVKGPLDAKWADRLAGMDITSNSPEDSGPVTTLVGQLRDQLLQSILLGHRESSLSV